MDITRLLRGKTVAAVMTNGHHLLIHASDGSELTLAWLDDNGRPLKGKPAAIQSGVRLKAAGVHDLIHFPGVRATGAA
jgi:hypothetical protein